MVVETRLHRYCKS